MRRYLAGPTQRRLISLMAALLVTALTRWVVFPLLAVGFKWLVLGRGLHSSTFRLN
jgi:ACR3 family arsenite efflux pump ArsB